MIDVRLGDCRDLLPTVADVSVDAVICDPPYPMILRPYGRLTEAEWWSLMMDVCREARRILKPTGSAVFILQPNSRKVGSMRGWLFEFQAWACREWNMVQDAWWWNCSAIPEAHAIQGRLMRPSIKACVWLGPSDCYRDQDSVLWTESDHHRDEKARARFARESLPSGHGMSPGRCLATSRRRGGVTPFNLLPVPHQRTNETRQIAAHGARTPLAICDWWTRYISPEGGTVCDPFMGGGTVGLAAIKRGRSFVGFEQMPEYFETARCRLAAEAAGHPLFGANA